MPAAQLPGFNTVSKKKSYNGQETPSTQRLAQQSTALTALLIVFSVVLPDSSTISMQARPRRSTTAKKRTTADPSLRNKQLLCAPPTPRRNGSATLSKNPTRQSQRRAPTVKSPGSGRFRGSSTVEGSAGWWYWSTWSANTDAPNTPTNRVGYSSPPTRTWRRSPRTASSR